MRIGCWKGWVFILGFNREAPIALVDSFLHRAFAPHTGAC